MRSPESKRPAELPRHPVRVVAQRTGLSSHVLRAWERRYGVVTPVRSEGGQRLYSDADIERLAFLRALTDSGYSIGQLAELSSGELRRLHREEPGPRAGQAPAQAGPDGAAADALRATALRAIEEFDAAALRRELESGAVSLGVPRFLEQVLAPLLIDIGLRWRAGRMTIAHEHLATAVVRQVLGWIRETAETRGAGPTLVVATPPRQRHEGGGLLVAAAAAAEGWRVTYLGADLPVVEIAEAARRTGARAVALSLLHPDDDPALGGELRALREALPPGVAVLAGGSAAPAYAAEIDAVGGEIVPDLPAVRKALRSLAAAAPARG
jgi:DNA-binding transcriptional MerR regulator/methylmalonyl-CoA mutase cobalamin-binding subunit